MATLIRKTHLLFFNKVDLAPLDGQSTGRTYQAKDLLVHAAAFMKAQTDAGLTPVTPYIVLDEEVDAVTITIDGTGADGNTAKFNMYGYGTENGDAERIYHTVTVTLGQAVAGTGRLYAEEIAGTDVHTGVIGIQDRELVSNSMAKITLYTRGLRYLYFEPTEFTTLTALTFHIREWGSK